jgi:Zn-finger nucleic acid-binding protein
MDSNAYLAWRKGRGETESRKSAEIKIDPAWDVDELKLCPNSGHIMGRYKILADSDFHLDRCGHCNGIWFDKHEWDALIELGLHDNVNEFFHPSVAGRDPLERGAKSHGQTLPGKIRRGRL